MTVAKRVALAAALGLIAGGPATAQSREDIVERFTGHVLNAQEFRDPNQGSDFAMEVEFRDGNVARFVAFGDESWAIWRVSNRREICTTVAILQGNTLVPVEEEECLRVRFNGDQVQLNFPSTTGGTIYYVGSLRPI